MVSEFQDISFRHLGVNLEYLEIKSILHLQMIVWTKQHHSKSAPHMGIRKQVIDHCWPRMLSNGPKRTGSSHRDCSQETCNYPILRELLQGEVSNYSELLFHTAQPNILILFVMQLSSRRWKLKAGTGKGKLHMKIIIKLFPPLATDHFILLKCHWTKSAPGCFNARWTL